MSHNKFLLLYHGPFYREKYVPELNEYVDYREDDIDKIVNQSGATDFILTTAYHFNICRFYPDGSTDKIVKANDYNSIPYSEYGTTNVEDIQTIREQAEETISTVDENNAYIEELASYTTYVESCISLTRRILKRKYRAKLWYGFPPMLEETNVGNVTTDAQRYNYYYKTFIFDLIYNELKTIPAWNNPTNASYGDGNFRSIWDENVSGFYYAQEGIPSWYTDFNVSLNDGIYNNNVVKNIKYVSELVHNTSSSSTYDPNRTPKRLVWIPYLDNCSDSIMERVGTLINKTNYFDIVMLQPSYYFHPQNNNLQLVFNDVATNVFYNVDGSIVGGSKTSTTEIGAFMEIDPNVLSDTDYRQRFQEYVYTFQSFITNNSRIVGFYPDRPMHFINGQYFTFPKIKSFLNYGRYNNEGDE